MHNFIPKRELFSNRATDPRLSKKCDKLNHIHVYAHCYIENKKFIIEPCSRHPLHGFLVHTLYIWCNDQFVLDWVLVLPKLDFFKRYQVLRHWCNRVVYFVYKLQEFKFEFSHQRTHRQISSPQIQDHEVKWQTMNDSRVQGTCIKTSSSQIWW